jgi:PadR family transcriptional regulator, regulatory protein PadR
MTRSSAMREPTYFVLASLLGGPLHGYAIIKRAEETVGGRVRRSYGLTEGGAAARRAEAQRMAEAARIVTSSEMKTVAGLPGRKPRTA